MSSLDAFDAIESRLKTAWQDTAGWSTIPLIFENEAFGTEATPKMFVFVEIFDDLYSQGSIGAPGNNLWTESGMAYLHVMVPKDTGTRKARTMAKALSDLFREKTSGGVQFADMSIGSGEPGREFPRYWAMTLTVNWYRRDFTTA